MIYILEVSITAAIPAVAATVSIATVNTNTYFVQIKSCCLPTNTSHLFPSHCYGFGKHIIQILFHSPNRFDIKLIYQDFGHVE